MTSLDSTGLARPARPEGGNTTRSADSTTASSDHSEPSAPAAHRSSPDPLVSTDRYRLTQPYTRRI